MLTDKEMLDWIDTRIWTFTNAPAPAWKAGKRITRIRDEIIAAMKEEKKPKTTGAG